MDTSSTNLQPASKQHVICRETPPTRTTSLFGIRGLIYNVDHLPNEITDKEELEYICGIQQFRFGLMIIWCVIGYERNCAFQKLTNDCMEAEVITRRYGSHANK